MERSSVVGSLGKSLQTCRAALIEGHNSLAGVFQVKEPGSFEHSSSWVQLSVFINLIADMKHHGISNPYFFLREVEVVLTLELLWSYLLLY